MKLIEKILSLIPSLMLITLGNVVIFVNLDYAMTISGIDSSVLTVKLLGGLSLTLLGIIGIQITTYLTHSEIHINKEVSHE